MLVLKQMRCVITISIGVEKKIKKFLIFSLHPFRGQIFAFLANRLTFLIIKCPFGHAKPPLPTSLVRPHHRHSARTIAALRSTTGPSKPEGRSGDRAVNFSARLVRVRRLPGSNP